MSASNDKRGPDQQAADAEGGEGVAAQWRPGSLEAVRSARDAIAGEGMQDAVAVDSDPRISGLGPSKGQVYRGTIFHHSWHLGVFRPKYPKDH